MSAAPSRPASTIHTPSSDQSFQYGLHLSPADPSRTSAQAPAHHHHHLAFQLPSPAPSMRDSDGTASTRSSAAQSAGDRHPWQLEDVRSFAPPSAPDAGGRAHLAPTDVLHRMDLGAGIGADVASLDPSFSFRPSGMSSGTHSASAGAPTSGGCGEAYEPAALDEVRFPASAFNSPSFAHASYGHPRSDADAQQQQHDFEASILRAPQLPSTARFDTPDLSAYSPAAYGHASPVFAGRPPSKAISIRDPRLVGQEQQQQQPKTAATAKPASSPASGALPGAAAPDSPKQAFKIVASPKRDAYEIAVEQGRIRAGVGIHSVQTSPVQQKPTARTTEQATRSMSSDQLSQLPQDELIGLIQAERARRDPATRNLSMHSDAFKQAAAAPSNAFRPALADDFGSSSNGFAHGERARAQTVSAVGDPPNHFGRAPAQRAVTGLPLDSRQAGAASGLGSLGLSSYFDGHVGAQHSSFASGVRSSSSYPPQALNDVDRQKHQLASFLSQPGPRSGSFTPAPVNYSQQHQQHHHAGSANGFGAGSHQGFNGGGGAAFEVDRSGGSAYGGGGGGNDQLADIIASLKRQQQQPQQRLHANGGARDHGFAVNVDHTRPQLSSFASASSYGSTAGLYSPGLRSPTPYSAGMGMPPDGGASNGSDVLTRLQAIRFLHPGVFGNHGDSSARDAHARQTPPHLDSAGLAAVGQQHPARANMAGGGADPASLARFLGATGLRHGINPVVMDPALQQYLLEHNLPLDGVSVTNKKAQLYKTEKCRSWEKNIHAKTPEERCQYGNKCQYAHGDHELRPVQRHPKYKTQICTTFWLLGSCAYGRRCCFLHNDIPAGGIPELGDLGTQEALRSILKARLSLVGVTGNLSDVTGPLDQPSPSSYLQSPGPNQFQFGNLSPTGGFNPASVQPSPRPSTSLPDERFPGSFGSTFARTAAAREASPYADRNLESSLLRPRDRSDSLSVNMAPVPELTPIPPSLPVPSALDYQQQQQRIVQQRPYVPGTPAPNSGLPMFNSDQHTRALAAVQAAHKQGAYQSSARSPATPTEDPVLLPRRGDGGDSAYAYSNPWASAKYRGSTETVGAIGDRGGQAARHGGDGLGRGKTVW